MISVSKYNCRYLAAALAHYGVSHVVVSPGSRNAPAIVAVCEQPGLTCHSAIDERTAAFMALGMAVQTGTPVALLCTSGSAPLNYTPALAEALYRRVPLIAVTADRPEEWIDQDDSQTIAQAHALDAVVKGSFDVPVCRGSDAGLRRLCAHRICDALMLATAGIPGPVHINLQIDEPINEIGRISEKITFPERRIPVQIPEYDMIDDLAGYLADKKVMVLAGFLPPDTSLIQALETLPANFAVLCEAQSNLHGPFCGNIDAALTSLGGNKEAQPDVVITIGGALLSRMIKTYLRGIETEHWSVGAADHCIDPLLHLTRRIEYAPATFFAALAGKAKPSACNYAGVWAEANRRGLRLAREHADASAWCDFKAMHTLLENMPRGINLHASNGTAVRYVQLFDYSHAARIECNRGVSGIDGCTSTAIGAAMVSDNPTLLVTGDMSAQYDMGALALPDVPKTFRMAVLNNSGGGIFRFIASTRGYTQIRKFLTDNVRLPLKQLAEGFGFDYYEAASEQSLAAALPEFFADNGRPAILNMITPADYSADILTNFFK